MSFRMFLMWVKAGILSHLSSWLANRSVGNKRECVCSKISRDWNLSIFHIRKTFNFYVSSSKVTLGNSETVGQGP